MGQATLQVRARSLGRNLLPWVALAVWLLATGSGVAPQNPNPPEVQAHEGQSQETNPPFKLHVERNLVTVKVVVRDGKDRPVGGLHQEDFRLFDDGKPQEILGFTVETGHPNPTPEGAPAALADKTAEATHAPAKAIAQRFVVLFFDDYHLQPEGIDRTRNAAWRYVTTAVRPEDRVAIFTATGKDQMDFTEDREKLHDALFRLAPRPRSSTGCPEVEDYEAYLADRLRDPDALRVLHRDAVKCTCGSDTTSDRPVSMMQQANRGGTPDPDPCPKEAMRVGELVATDVWSQAEMQSQDLLQGIENSVRRLAALPGQRTLVLVSVGFLTETQMLHDQIDAIINRALHQDVVISAVDAAGLYTYEPYRTAMGTTLSDPDGKRGMLEHTALVVSRDVLASLADGTGGVFFHNSNDFDEGFRQAAAVPEVYYVLTFSPANIKLDGKFHTLKVTFNSREPYTIQARRGYFASESGLAGQASSQDELEKVVFSQEEIHGLPGEVKAQVVQGNEHESKLEVMIHIDVRQMQFRKEADRNVDKLIFHTTLFDRDGKYVDGKEASLDLHLKDATLEKLTQSGINATTNFQVTPGTYRIREVVRDTESKIMSALNCVVEVPGAPPKP